jgi:hypothetical protein
MDTRDSFHHQLEALHPRSSAIHKTPAEYLFFRRKEAMSPTSPNFHELPEVDMVDAVKYAR